MSDFVEYPLETMVRIKSTDEIGEAYESAFGFITVFVEGNDKAQIFPMDDVEFLSLDNKN
jgi:hypothetical protein